MSHKNSIRLLKVDKADGKPSRIAELPEKQLISSGRLTAQNKYLLRRETYPRALCAFCDERFGNIAWESRDAAYSLHLDQRHELELYTRDDYVCACCPIRHRSVPALMFHFVQFHRAMWRHDTIKSCKRGCNTYRQRPRISRNQPEDQIRAIRTKVKHEELLWELAFFEKIAKLRSCCDDEEQFRETLAIGQLTSLRSSPQFRLHVVPQMRRKLSRAAPAGLKDSSFADNDRQHEQDEITHKSRRPRSGRSGSESSNSSWISRTSRVSKVSRMSRVSAAAISEDGVSEVARPFQAFITNLHDLKGRVGSQHQFRQLFFPAIVQEKRKLLKYTISIIEITEQIFEDAMFLEHADMAYELIPPITHFSSCIDRHTPFPGTCEAYQEFSRLLKSLVDPILQLWRAGVETRERFLDIGQDIIDSVF